MYWVEFSVLYGRSLLVIYLPSMQEMKGSLGPWAWSLGQEDPLEKEMATHSIIIAWRIPRTKEPSGQQSIGSQRIRHNWSDWAHVVLYIYIYIWQIDGETRETVKDFTFLGSKITADGDCSHEIKRRLLLGRKVMTNLVSIIKSRDITWSKMSISSKLWFFQ